MSIVELLSFSLFQDLWSSGLRDVRLCHNNFWRSHALSIFPFTIHASLLGLVVGLRPKESVSWRVVGHNEHLDLVRGYTSRPLLLTRSFHQEDLKGAVPLYHSKRSTTHVRLVLFTRTSSRKAYVVVKPQDSTDPVQGSAPRIVLPLLKL